MSDFHSEFLNSLEELWREMSSCCGCSGRAKFFSVDRLIELRIREMFSDIGWQRDFSVLFQDLEPLVMRDRHFDESPRVGLADYLKLHAILEDDRPPSLQSFSRKTHNLPDVRRSVAEKETFHRTSFEFIIYGF